MKLEDLKPVAIVDAAVVPVGELLGRGRDGWEQLAWPELLVELEIAAALPRDVNASPAYLIRAAALFAYAAERAPAEYAARATREASERAAAAAAEGEARP